MSSSTNVEGRPRNTLLFVLKELKPRGPFLTPFNIVSIPVILLGMVILVIRFTDRVWVR